MLGPHAGKGGNRLVREHSGKATAALSFKAAPDDSQARKEGRGSSKCDGTEKF